MDTPSHPENKRVTILEKIDEKNTKVESRTIQESSICAKVAFSSDSEQLPEILQLLKEENKSIQTSELR